MKRKILLFLLVLLFAWLIGREWWWKTPSDAVSSVTVVIEEGASVTSVADQLKDQKIIGSPYFFKVYTKLTGRVAKIQVGAFELNPGSSDADVLNIITQPQVNEITLTFVEGWTLDQMGDYLVSKGVVTKAEWNAAATPDLEGYLFPDTYRFSKGVSAKEIVDRLRAEMNQVLTVAWRLEIDRQGKSVHDIITMASIIEREVRHPEDRANVSDIFWKRLDIGMPLQADSTVNYITGKKTPSISFADRDIDSPYNTYQNRGLPPGPIAAPARSAIEAAIYPASNPYYYFLTDAPGNVHYGRTLDEHNMNKAKYLK